MAKQSKPGRLNDQNPKPRLGNDKNLHGHKSVDWMGGANPPSVKRNKGKSK